jgi:hypothetical protein
MAAMLSCRLIGPTLFFFVANKTSAILNIYGRIVTNYFLHVGNGRGFVEVEIETRSILACLSVMLAICVQLSCCLALLSPRN